MEILTSNIPFHEVLEGQKNNNHIIRSEEKNARIVLTYDGVVKNIDNIFLSAYKGDQQKEIFRNFNIEKVDETFRFFSKWPLFSDGEYHKESKKIIGQYFHNLISDEKENYFKSYCQNILKKTKFNQPNNVLESYCYNFSTSYLSYILGIDNNDIKKLHGWTKSLITLMGLREYNETKISNAINAYHELKKYLNTIQEDGKGLISYMKKHTNLNEEEYIAIIGNLLIDGYEPTALTIANGIKYGIEYNELLNHISDGGNISDIIHEINRIEPVFPYTSRLSIGNIELLGSQIQNNQRIIFMLLTANRDGTIFPNPNKFNIERSNNKVNLTFGSGKHSCIGRGLAHHSTTIGLSEFYNFIIDNKKKFKITKEIEHNEFYLKGYKELYIQSAE